MFGVLSHGDGHTNAMYRSQNDSLPYLWIDPNFGVWRMTREKLKEALIYLYARTGKEGEKGVYEINGDLIPSRFEYSIWEAS